jgi:hypothetical protein
VAAARNADCGIVSVVGMGNAMAEPDDATDACACTAPLKHKHTEPASKLTRDNWCMCRSAISDFDGCIALEERDIQN